MFFSRVLNGWFFCLIGFIHIQFSESGWKSVLTWMTAMFLFELMWAATQISAFHSVLNYNERVLLLLLLYFSSYFFRVVPSFGFSVVTASTAEQTNSLWAILIVIAQDIVDFTNNTQKINNPKAHFIRLWSFSIEMITTGQSTARGWQMKVKIFGATHNTDSVINILEVCTIFWIMV